MESETSIVQQRHATKQPQQQQQQQQQPQQQQQQQQQRRPESVLASEAEKRASTSHGRPDTSDSTNHKQGNNNNNQRPLSKQTSNEIHNNRPTSRDIIVTNGSSGNIKTPHTTPRDPNGVLEDGDTVGNQLRSVVSSGGNAVAGEEDIFENILDEDELFMALSENDREEWDRMMSDREQKLADSKGKHQNWSDSFIRRRMFAYSRMRKLNLSYQDRIQLFSSLSNTINNVASRRLSAENNVANSKKTPMTKRMSEPILESKNESSAGKSGLKHSLSSGGLTTTDKDHRNRDSSVDVTNSTTVDTKTINNTNHDNVNDSFDLNASGRTHSRDVCTVEQVT